MTATDLHRSVSSSLLASLLLTVLLSPTVQGDGGIHTAQVDVLDEDDRLCTKDGRSCSSSSSTSLLQVKLGSHYAAGVISKNNSKAVAALVSSKTGLLSASSASSSMGAAHVSASHTSAASNAGQKWGDRSHGGEQITTLLYLLPIVGLALALCAVAVTLFLEVGWANGGSSAATASALRRLRPSANGPSVRTFSCAGLAPNSNRNLGCAAESVLQKNAAVHAAAGGPQTCPLPHTSSRAPQPCSPPVGQIPTPNDRLHEQDAMDAPRRDATPRDAPRVKRAGVEVQVEVPTLPEDGTIGVKLSEEDLRVTGFEKMEASRYGLLVGDRIIAINGGRVSTKPEFMYWMQVAQNRNLSLQNPIVFTVWRSSTEPNRSTSLAEAGSITDQEWTGVWQYDEASEGMTHTYILRRDEEGRMIFEQQLPSGELAHGVCSMNPFGQYEADLKRASGQAHGIVRLRLNLDGTIASNLRQGDDGWGADIIARKISTTQGQAGVLQLTSGSQPSLSAGVLMPPTNAWPR